MTQELQIKATILDLESKTDKNGNPYYRLSLAGIPGRYFYAFSYYLSTKTWQILTIPHNLLNRQVLISYQELASQDQSRTFCKVKDLQIL